MPEEIPEAASNDRSDPEASSAPPRPFSLPAWLDHFSAADLKVVLRCWVAIWVSSLLMFIGPSLNSIGIATFFGPLLLYLMPPAGILLGYLLGAFSLLFGMCLAWAWGLLTMKAALAARPELRTQELLRDLKQQAIAQSRRSGKSAAWETQKLIHEGFMLDARVTVIFYVMSCVFIYVMARLRVTNHKFTPAEVFGIIVTDLFLLLGPTLPSFTGELGKVLVEPGAIGIGLGAVCCLLFFPQSTSYTVLGKMEQLALMGQKSLQSTRARLAGQPMELSELQSTRQKMISIYKATQPMLAFLPLDLSRGRWSADDVRGLHEPLQQLLAAQMALLDFHIARVELEQKLRDIPSGQEKGEDNAEEKPPREAGHRQLQQTADLMLAWKAPELSIFRQHARESLNQSTAEVLQLYSEGLTVVAESFHIVNSRRWTHWNSPEQSDQLVTQGEEILRQLRSARRTCVTDTTERLIACHADLFDEDGNLHPADHLGPHSLRSLVLGMVVEERILACAAATERLLMHILQLLKSRKRDRIWLPSGPRYALSWLANSHVLAPMPESSIGTDEDPDIPKQQANAVYQQLHISRGYGTRRRPRLLIRIIRDSYHWLTNPGGIYALRMVVVTIATAIPASLPSSAGFFYREKGLWGVITAQICVLVYMADFTFSLLGRVAGTVVGGLMGMVAWYIGSGCGPGNPYGLAAITAVMTLLLVWCRLFFPRPLTGLAVMSGITFVLVLGFSYDATHLDAYGLPGYGYEAFYKRVVTVLAGVVAALIVQIFPRPPSASRHVRKSLSNTIRTLSDHYALLLSRWNRRDSSPSNGVMEEISLEVTESLLSLVEPIGLLKFEMSMDSFDQHTLGRTRELCRDMNQALAHLLSLSDTLPLNLQEQLATTVNILDEQNIAAIMAVLGVIDQALKTGDPLPERLPTPFLSRYYETNRQAVELNTTLLRSEGYRHYCVAVSSYFRFLSAVDNLVLVLKRALGETHIVDWREEEARV